MLTARSGGFHRPLAVCIGNFLFTLFRGGSYRTFIALQEIFGDDANRPDQVSVVMMRSPVRTRARPITSAAAKGAYLHDPAIVNGRREKY